jgi:hypothetical protein
MGQLHGTGFDEGDGKFFEIFFVLRELGGFWFGYCWLGFQIEKKYALELNLGYVVFIIVGFLLSWFCLGLLKWFYKKVFF